MAVNDNDMYAVASAFLSETQVALSVDELTNNDSDMNVGIDMTNMAVVFTLGTECIMMEPDYAEFVGSAIWGAAETIRALVARESN